MLAFSKPCPRLGVYQCSIRPCLNRWLWVGLLLVLIAFPGVLQANGQPPHLALSPASSVVYLDGSLSTISAGWQLEYLEDPSRTLTLAQILAPEQVKNFIANNKASFPIGRSTSAWWVRFKVERQTEEDWFLLLDSLLGDEFDLYIFPVADTPFNASTPEAVKQATFNYAKPIRDFYRRAWQLHLPKQQTMQVYIRATNGDSVTSITPELLKSEALLKRSNRAYGLNTFIYAGMIILGLYHLFMFIILRDLSYLFLATNIFAMMLTIHRTNPVFPFLAVFSYTGSYFFTTPFFIAISSIFAYSRRMLDTAIYAPRLDKIMRFLMYCSLALITITGAIPAGTIIPLLLGLATLFLLFFGSIYIAFRGSRVAKYYTLAFTFVVFLQTENALTLLFQASAWQAYHDVIPALGTLLFMLFLSLIQATQVRVLNEEVQRNKAQAKAKDEFLAIMSHELRTPLNAISGLSTLLRLSQPLTDVQQAYLNKLQVATQHINQLIANVLDFSKLRSHTEKIRSEVFRLDIALQSIESLTQQQALQKNLDFQVICEGALEENVLGDRIHLSQVLLNLLNNALKYTEQGSVLLTVKAQQQPEYLLVAFVVKDTGPGISAKHLMNLFEPYVQYHHGCLPQGVGLGLHISKMLVEAMGGYLKVNSIVGKGSEFYFELQLARVVEPAGEAKRIAAQPSYRFPVGVRALVVDDSDTNRFVIAELLKSFGAIVDQSSGAKAAILNLQDYNYDLVLADISMPDMDGYALANWIRQYYRIPSVPIIVLTAHALPEVEQQANAMGVNAFLTKPCGYEDLFNACYQVLKAVYQFK